MHDAGCNFARHVRIPVQYSKQSSLHLHYRRSAGGRLIITYDFIYIDSHIKIYSTYSYTLLYTSRNIPTPVQYNVMLYS